MEESGAFREPCAHEKMVDVVAIGVERVGVLTDTE